MTSAPLTRRRLLTGSGAALGLALLAGCDSGVSPRASAAGGATRRRARRHPPRRPPARAVALASAPDDGRRGRPQAVEAPRLAARLEEYLDGRSGSLGLELVDLTRGEVFRHDAREAECYSTIKVLILTTVLRQAQEAGKQLTAAQKKLARRMITRSDNAATETLLAEAGRDEVRRVAAMVGMEHTEIDEGWWGFWRTVPGDLNLMTGALLSTDDVLDGGRRAQARFLMADVVPEQRWGVFAAEDEDADAYVAAKNGWGPLPERVPAQLDRLGQRRRSRLRAQHPVQQPRRVPLRPADDLGGRRHLPRGARGPAGLTEPRTRGRLRWPP